MALSRNSYYRGFGWLTQFGVITLLVVAPFSDRWPTLYNAGQAVAALGLVGQCAMDYSNEYLKRVLALFSLLVAILAAAAFAHSYIHHDAELFWTGLKAFGEEFVLILLVTTILFCHTESPVYDRLWEHPRILWIILSLAFVWFWVLISSMSSADQEQSFRFVRKQIGPYFLLFLLAIDTVRTWARFRRLALITFIAGSATCALSVLAYLFYLYASHYEWRAWELWLSSDDQGFWVRLSPNVSDVEVQAQYPFRHPNRLGSFGVVISMLSLAVFQMTRRLKPRLWIVAGGMIAFVAIVISGTRGAMIAAVAGAMVYACLRDRRLMGVLAALLVVGYLAAPSSTQERVGKIFSPSTYNLEKGNVARRAYLALISWEMIKDYPVFGIGYDTEIFEDMYEERYHQEVAEKYGLPGLRDDPENKSHAHNNFLHYGAVAGIPAMLGLIVFTFALGAGLLRRVWPPHAEQRAFSPMGAALFALLVALTLYGLTNYNLRYGIGMYISLISGLSVAFIQLSAQPPESVERPPK